jgi:hypothetical protein
MKKWPKFLDFEFLKKSKFLQQVLVGSQIREGFLIFKMIQIWKHLTMDEYHFGYKKMETKRLMFNWWTIEMSQVVLLTS